MYVVVSTISLCLTPWDDPELLQLHSSQRQQQKELVLIGSKQDFQRQRKIASSNKDWQHKTGVLVVDDPSHDKRGVSSGKSDASIAAALGNMDITNNSTPSANLDFTFHNRYSDSTAQLTTSPDKRFPSFSIFYNIYIPTDQGQTGSDRAKSIVAEQMNQIGASYAATFEQPVLLYYNTIGMADIVTAAYMNNTLCVPNHIECIHMQHYETGFEEHTLQRLHEYCHAQPDTSDVNDADTDADADTNDPHQQHHQHRVVYMHNKGSYHDWGGENTRWRSHLTQAVTTKECLQPVIEKCSVCGLLFFGAWALIFPGNFWVADCAYIRKLPPPPTFFVKMDDVFRQRQDKIQENPLYKIAFPDVVGIDSHGAGRYSQEHWIGSHPSLQPCVLTVDPLTEWRQRWRNASEFSWTMFPPPDKINDPTTDLDRPPLIAGNLFKWFTLYGHAPADDSWVWTWFPYGEKYKQAVKLYGNRTFDVMVTSEIERFQTMFGPTFHEKNQQGQSRRRN